MFVRHAQRGIIFWLIQQRTLQTNAQQATTVPQEPQIPITGHVHQEPLMIF